MSTCSRTWEKRATDIEIIENEMMKTGKAVRSFSSVPWLLIVIVITASLAAMSQDQPAAQPPAAQAPEPVQAPGPGATSQGEIPAHQYHRTAEENFRD